MSFQETTLSEEVILDGLIFRVDRMKVRLEDGRESRRDILRHPGGVGVLGRKPCGTWLLVRQFRKALEKTVTEIVAGMREPGEDAETAARRELEEETGHTAVRMVYLGCSFASPGYTDEVVELFYADLSAEAGANRLDHDERVEVVPFTDAEMHRAFAENALPDSKTMAAWMLAGEKGLRG